MEVLSGVASGMAVASLSLQLLESVGKLKTLIRDVKGASKELDRLANLLDRLNALLEDVRNIMERQTSLQAEHFPAPSMTIYHCLKSCEDSLTSLQNEVDKYMAKGKQSDSVLIRIKDDIKFGLRTKDIAAFEVKIQREIDYLHTALSVNSAAILMATVPTIMTSQQHCMDICHDAPQLSASLTTRDAAPTLSEVSGMNTQVRRVWTSSTLRLFGVHWRKSACYVHARRKEERARPQRTASAVSQSYELLLTWSLLRYGLSWSRQYAYRGLAISLTCYPVVQDLWDYKDLMKKESCEQIQQIFSSGRLHPFTRDVYGESLLHLAAAHHRADICQLLVQYGLKPDIAASYMSPLFCTLFYSPVLRRGSQLDTIRLMLQQCDQVDDLEEPHCPILVYHNISTMEESTVDWLWHNISTVFEDHDVLTLRCILVQKLIDNISSLPAYSPEATTRIRYLVDLMTPEVVQQYIQGRFSLLKPLFRFRTCSQDSHWYGQVLLDLLKALDIDAKACMDTEFSNLADARLQMFGASSLDRKVVFEQLDDQCFLLSWIWDISSCEPGYLIVSEYVGLGPDFDWYYSVWDYVENGIFFIGDCWPFSDAHPDLHEDGYSIKDTPQEKRFERREANKARKERARTGNKRPRRMPGAWSW